MEDQCYQNERKEAIIRMCSERKQEEDRICNELKELCEKIGSLIAQRDLCDAMKLDKDLQYNELCSEIRELQKYHDKKIKEGMEKVKKLQRESAILTGLLD